MGQERAGAGMGVEENLQSNIQLDSFKVVLLYPVMKWWDAGRLQDKDLIIVLK